MIVFLHLYSLSDVVLADPGCFKILDELLRDNKHCSQEGEETYNKSDTDDITDCHTDWVQVRG